MLVIKDVSKSYGGQSILNNINLEIPPKKSIGIIGRNGSGKTTLVNIMTFIEKPDQGTINYSLKKDEIPYKIGVQMQDGSFEEYVKLGELVEIFCDIYGVSHDTGHYFLKKFDLLHVKKTYLNKLSGGEKQKVNILLAILHDPEIIFFDEITTGLDAISRKNIIKILKDIKSEGKNLILISHYYEEIWNLCDYVLILGRGKTLFKGEKKSIADNYKKFSQKIDEIIGEDHE